MRTIIGFGLVAVLAVGNGRACAADVSGYQTNLVIIQKERYSGRDGITVELTDALQQSGTGNGPTYAIPQNVTFTNGVIEADIAGELNGKGGPDTRAFVGIAFHLSADAQTYEAVYLRMTNGTLNNPPPPPPRDVRAVQYVAHPDFHFDISRAQFPGKYEKAAPVALGRWHHLKLEVQNSHLKASVDGVVVLQVDDLKYADRTGGIGLWTDLGTKAHFANLKITKADEAAIQ